MWWKTTSTLVYIMSHSLNVMEPNLITPFLSMIDKYDRLKNIGGNEFILLMRGLGCCMAGNATKTDLLLCWTTHIFLYHMYFTWDYFGSLRFYQAANNILLTLILYLHICMNWYPFIKITASGQLITIKEWVSQAFIIRGTASKSALVEMRQ